MEKKLTPKSCGHKTVPLDHFQSYRIILRSVDTIQYPHTNQYPTLYIHTLYKSILDNIHLLSPSTVLKIESLYIYIYIHIYTCIYRYIYIQCIYIYLSRFDAILFLTPKASHTATPHPRQQVRFRRPWICWASKSCDQPVGSTKRAWTGRGTAENGVYPQL